jgi:hypothetical protein
MPRPGHLGPKNADLSGKSIRGHGPAVTRKKTVSGSRSEQDDNASGFTWVAREP